ncbi:hypothetical protein RUM43_004504 [Polyplax serrata]|uniref:Factor VIII intron 22 protein n=1 Tax=Polyplax serrata TaxID=468196 RepID=A0AAN8XN94_POLSC
MCDEKIDILLNYQNISNKLRKKRILKKPNVTEAGQQFENLGKICEREELEQYAGLCYQAAAKCQNSLGNHLEEGFLLLKSSKQFMTGYSKLLRNQLVLDETYKNYSYANYKECLTRIQQNKEYSNLVTDMVTSGIILEMASNLKDKFGATEESCEEHERALKFFSNSPAERINCLQKLVVLHIESENYTEALKLIDEIVTQGELLPDTGLKNEAMRNAEITKIFLLLILQPTPQQISVTAAAALEKYAWVETASSGEVKELQTMLNDQGLSMLDENLFLKLQSLVMACQYSDVEVLTCVESDLIPDLTVEQKILLNTLIKQYK